MKQIIVDKPNRGVPPGGGIGIHLSAGDKLVIDYGGEIGYVLEFLGTDRHNTAIGNFRVDEVDGADGVNVGAEISLNISATVKLAHCILT
ncbi:hypothetical protein KBC86_03115 [Candidatus Gracilibacteria bacterium]|nr:hypothetical protein [Candidatus Gracilibacteria bacterium]